MKDYIKWAYPHWIREDTYRAGSLTDQYDEVRGFTFEWISDNILSTARELLIWTATEIWITEWENFLNINWEGRTLEERRGLLLATITWWQTTLSLMKAIVYLVTWGTEASITFQEYWITWATGDDVFSYEIIINDNLLTLTYDVVILREIVENIQPAHCTLFITITNDLIDSVGTWAVLESALLDELTWDVGTWEEDPMIANVWW